MKRIVLWGTGKVATSILSNSIVLEAYEILGVIDNNSQKQGQSFFGYTIFAPEVLNSFEKIDNIVVLLDAFEDVYSQIIEINPIFEKLIDDKNYFYKQSIICRYKEDDDEQIREVTNYISSHRLQVFNYPFVDKYKNYMPKVSKDGVSGLFYVIHQGRKLFFSREFDDEYKVVDYYRSILMEQDEKSPHRYMTDDFGVNQGDVVIDIGVAEGNFSLEIIEKAKKVYLIESDPLWIEALKYTFKNYKDKVCILDNFISDYNEGKISTLDNIIHEKIDFIKMDIEGSEYEALKGARKLLSANSGIKLSVCCYHSDFDQELIENELKIQGFEFCTTDGYMWYPLTNKQSNISTQLHRGIIRAFKY